MSNSINNIDTLPPELLLHTLSFLSIQDISNLSCINKKMKTSSLYQKDQVHKIKQFIDHTFKWVHKDHGKDLVDIKFKLNSYHNNGLKGFPSFLLGIRNELAVKFSQFDGHDFQMIEMNLKLIKQILMFENFDKICRVFQSLFLLIKANGNFEENTQKHTETHLISKRLVDICLNFNPPEIKLAYDLTSQRPIKSISDECTTAIIKKCIEIKNFKFILRYIHFLEFTSLNPHPYNNENKKSVDEILLRLRDEFLNQTPPDFESAIELNKKIKGPRFWLVDRIVTKCMEMNPPHIQVAVIALNETSNYENSFLSKEKNEEIERNENAQKLKKCLEVFNYCLNPHVFNLQQAFNVVSIMPESPVSKDSIKHRCINDIFLRSFYKKPPALDLALRSVSLLTTWNVDSWNVSPEITMMQEVKAIKIKLLGLIIEECLRTNPRELQLATQAINQMPMCPELDNYFKKINDVILNW